MKEEGGFWVGDLILIAIFVYAFYKLNKQSKSKS